VVVYTADDAGVRSALDQARSADIVIKTSGVGVFDDLLELAVLECKAQHAIAIFWDVDAPATLDRLERDPGDPLRSLIPQYDMVLTYGGGSPVVEAYERVGARLCVPIYNALDPSTHYPSGPDPRFAADLGFLGNRLPDREHRVEEFFLRAARLLPSRTFLLGGNGWKDKPMPMNVHYVGHVYTHEHNAFNSTPTILLNINRDSMARYGFSPATRVFEAAGAGACIVTDAWLGVEQFLEPEREVLVASSGDEVAAYVAAIDAATARAIGQAALRRVMSEHTYAHRVLQLEGILGESAAA
jgi:spore maturation protein CgeB